MEPPLVKGGQGRSGDEITKSASFIVRIIIYSVLLLFSFACWVGAWKVVEALFGD